MNRGATSPFTLQSEVKHTTTTPPLPPQRDLCSEEAFHVWDWEDYGVLGTGGGMSSEQVGNWVGRVCVWGGRATWLESNCPALSAFNEAR